MKKLIVANWKLNPLTESEAVSLARKIDHKNVVVCPPFPFLPAVRKVLKRAALGAQDVFWEPHGAYTGEVSGLMLKSVGARYVIIGHSERRAYFGESDDAINEKIHAALASGLKVIVCVGEPRAVRRWGFMAARRFVARQLKRDLRGVKEKVIVAYEPIWAIGSGTSDKPEETVRMAMFIKKFCAKRFALRSVSVLYGGSVKPGNARGFLIRKEINGALVGGASLKASEFKKIVQAAGK